MAQFPGARGGAVRRAQRIEQDGADIQGQDLQLHAETLDAAALSGDFSSIPQASVVHHRRIGARVDDDALGA